MRTALVVALTISLGGCAAPLSSIDPAKIPARPAAAPPPSVDPPKVTTPPAVASPPKPIVMPDGWKRRYVPKRFQGEDVNMLASFVKLEANARLFVWGEPEGSTPKDLAETLVVTTLAQKGKAAINTKVALPNVGVFLFDPISGRGGYTLYCQTADGRVMTLDADFPVEHGEEIIKDIDEIARQIR